MIPPVAGWLRFLLASLLWLAGAAFAETRNVDTHFFGQNLGDFKIELASAAKEGKRGVLLMFEQDGCPYCHAMREHVLSQSEVQDYYRRHFLIFSVDIKGDSPLVDFHGNATTEKKFAALAGIKGTPTFIFYDLAGQPMTRFTGVTKGGVAEFLALGRYVVGGDYRNTSFPEYRKKHLP